MFSLINLLTACLGVALLVYGVHVAIRNREER